MHIFNLILVECQCDAAETKKRHAKWLITLNLRLKSEGRETVRRKTKIKIIYIHTFQIKERILRGNISTFVGAFEICGCYFFSSLSF